MSRNPIPQVQYVKDVQISCHLELQHSYSVLTNKAKAAAMMPPNERCAFSF